MKTIVVANQKGGVGKTTMATHMAFYIRDMGKKVLFVDLDGQANSTSTLQDYATDLQAASLFENGAPEIEAREGISLIGAEFYSLLKLDTAPVAAAATFVAALNHLAPSFDYCVIDTAPAAGTRMMAALMAANFVLSPIELDGYSLDGIKKMLQTIFGAKQRHNPGLTFLGILPNRFNAHSVSQKDNLMELIGAYPQLLIPAKISTRSSIPDALRQRIPVWEVPKTAAREAGKEIKDVFDQLFKKMEVQP